ncbi:MAG TPA: metal ABC transporter substrate-binding protein [Actinomycetota bacterium]|nr:metal ABC transporter substrate-binding protein [Actinomycetota bacterium]
MVVLRVALAAVAMLAGGCSIPEGAAEGARPRVVASFYPLAFVVEQVGGNLVELENLTPPGAEPHDLELSPGYVRALAGAELVVYIGNGFQPSVEDALAEIEAAQIDALAAQRDLLRRTEHEARAEHEAGGEHDEAAVDPHVWLDPQRLAVVAAEVAQRLAEIDPDDADRFRDNARSLQARLDQLDGELRHGLARCDRTTMVTSHEAFGYLAAAYGLEEVGITGIDPEAEPSPRRLADVADFVRDNDVTTIFFEVLVPPDIAETLADEVGVETARLDPLEGPPESGDYFTAMITNLDALREGLGCR